jgi:hypothetical protein
MAYGHAERNLALIRQLEAETAQLLRDMAEPDPEQPAWPRDAASHGKPTVTPTEGWRQRPPRPCPRGRVHRER